MCVSNSKRSTCFHNAQSKYLLIARGLVQVQDMEGLGAHHLSLFNIPTIKKLIKVGQMCTYWFDWHIPENVRWEKVPGLFVPRWLTYSTGSLPILNCHHLSSVFFWPSLIHKSSWGQHPILYFLFIIDIHLRTISTCSMALKTSPVSKCRRSEIILSDQVLLTLWLTW